MAITTKALQDFIDATKKQFAAITSQLAAINARLTKDEAMISSIQTTLKPPVSVDPCYGVPTITDSLSHPPPTSGAYEYDVFQPTVGAFPAVGSSFTDPIFCKAIRRLTNRTGGINNDDNYAHHWINADATACFHRLPAQNNKVISVVTGADLYTGLPTSSTLNAGGNTYWDVLDPDKFYYFSGSSLMRRNLLAGTNTTMHTFGNTLTSTGASLNIQSGDGRYFIVNVSESIVLWDSQSNIEYTNPPNPGTIITGAGWATITPDAKYIVIASGAGSTNYSYAVDHVAHSVGSAVMFWSNNADHGDFVSASNGKNYKICSDDDSADGMYRVDISLDQSAASHAAQRAANTKLFTLTVNDGMHASRVSRGSLSDWCFLSISSINDLFDNRGTWVAYRSEIIAANAVTLEVRRLAHHRSRSVASNYQYFPRVSCSPTGNAVLWTSNFNDNDSPPVGGGYADLFMIANPLS